MNQTVILVCNRVIEYAFYALFFLVPLVFTSVTSELFEFNKMWITYILTIVIITGWFTKMTCEKKITILRTPLDIPLLLFLGSQIIATIFSLDSYVSFWGYYSRFNGGLLSTICYILLYYAFVSNVFAIQRDSINARSNQNFSLAVRSMLCVFGLFMFLLGIFLSSPPSSQELSGNQNILFICMIIAFFFFIWSFPKGFFIRLLFINFMSASIVSVWGLLSHFGKDPTCYLFRHVFDVTCWTYAFQPTVRIFSTLGQPAWLAAYLAALLPLCISLFLIYVMRPKASESSKGKFFFIVFCYVAVITLFYADLTFTDTRAGFVAFWAANIFFWIGLLRGFSKALIIKSFISLTFIFLLINFFFGFTLYQLNKFTYSSVKSHFAAHPTAPAPTHATTNKPSSASLPNAGEMEGQTDSGNIRLYVWKGAIDAWKSSPLFGTGVETFAFAYYKFRPAGHNMTSEWDFLYNKAHNEYLNYLTTTGLFGVGSYLAFIGLFIFITLQYLFTHIRNLSLSQNKPSDPKNQQLGSNHKSYLIILALFCSFLTITVSNFFGFSVVIINLYFFLIPAVVLLLMKKITASRVFTFSLTGKETNRNDRINLYQWTGIGLYTIAGCFFLFVLWHYWQADVAYAYGYNLDRVGENQQAYPFLNSAVKDRASEPVFKDELAGNSATLALALSQQKDTTNASQLAQQAVALSNQVIESHPNNVVFWKDRVRMFDTLAQANPQLLSQALDAIKKANVLAPTDAKTSYFLGVIYGQTGEVKKGIEVLQDTIKLKPDYRDAYYALGLFYHDQAVDQKGKVVNPEMEKKAEDTMHYILTNLAPDDKETLKILKSWNAM